MFNFSVLQQIGICDIQAEGDGKNHRERYTADLQSVQQARPQQHRENYAP